jgi:uncharacterized protein YndB with AHSA1/START domain
MKTAVLMDFVVDKDNKTIHVKREFAASLKHVWAAWTEKDLLDQWWAPKPWQAKTKTLNFEEGGYWLYAMVGPEGQQDWCRVDFKSIEPMRSFSASDAFCDEDGNVTNVLPPSLWKNDFNPVNDSTVVSVNISFNETADLEKYIEMGFKEGFTAALENLDELLS